MHAIHVLWRMYMKLTRKDVAQRIIDYLHHRITLAELVDWAENITMEADFENHDFETCEI